MITCTFRQRIHLLHKFKFRVPAKHNLRGVPGEQCLSAWFRAIALCAAQLVLTSCEVAPRTPTPSGTAGTAQVSSLTKEHLASGTPAPTRLPEDQAISDKPTVRLCVVGMTGPITDAYNGWSRELADDSPASVARRREWRANGVYTAEARLVISLVGPYPQVWQIARKIGWSSHFSVFVDVTDPETGKALTRTEEYAMQDGPGLNLDAYRALPSPWEVVHLASGVGMITMSIAVPFVRIPNFDYPMLVSIRPLHERCKEFALDGITVEIDDRPLLLTLRRL